MTRAELQRIARDRLHDAKALLAARRWSGAYYLAGYAVECGLKSCVIRFLMTTDQFPERRYSEQCWTHDLERLVALSGLTASLAADMTRAPDLAKNWGITKDWEESSRYARMTKIDAENLYPAIVDKPHGVFSWLKKHW